jgi:SAM-dependent methyltransferase
LPALIRRIKDKLKRLTGWKQLDPLSEQVGVFWDSESKKEAVYWTEHGAVRQYANELITGVDWLFPLSALKAGWANRAWPKAVSIGCGTGNLERALREMNICREVTGYDVSRESIREAKKLARAERYSGLKYRIADANTLTLKPRSITAAFFHGSLHHIDNVDGVLDQVDAALQPGGFVYIDDYVGPSRDEWSDDHLTEVKAAWEEYPEEMRLWPVNPPLDYRDPSEMIRSSRILPALREKFEIIHYKPYWGNFIFPLFCTLDGAALRERPDLVAAAIEKERALVAEGVYQTPLFAVVLARKRS